MKREGALRRRAESIKALSEAVGAMKSLAAHHFRSARSALPSARAYRQEVEEAVAALRLHHFPSTGTTSAVLMIGGDLGLCGAYHSELAAKAVQVYRQFEARRLYCVGQRSKSTFRRWKLVIDRGYRAPTSVAGLPEILMRVGEDLLTDYLDGQFASLIVVSAQFDGVGKFTPVAVPLLPIAPPMYSTEIKPSDYVPMRHLAAVVIREYLYIRLFQASLDALASEHGARLVATESAAEWLDQKAAMTRRQLIAVRREGATQEVLDIMSAAKRRLRANSV